MGLALRMDPRREAWSDAMQKGCRSPRRESMHENRRQRVAACLVGAACAGAVLGLRAAGLANGVSSATAHVRQAAYTPSWFDDRRRFRVLTGRSGARGVRQHLR
jgi:hypothetical protein